MNIDVLEKTYLLSDEIKKTTLYKEVEDLNKRIESELKSELEVFVDAKEKYYEAQKYGKYHPSLSEYTKELSRTKAILYSKDIVKQYNEKYNELQKLLNDILDEIKINMSNKFELTNSKKKCGCKK